jgi:hypothetical protein
VNGLIGAILPWSTGLLATGSLSEAAASTLWNTQFGLLCSTATNGLNNFWSADITTTNTTVSTLDPATFRQTTLTKATLSEVGTDANPSLPWNIAHVITLRSSHDNKGGHGRMFLAPFAEDNIAAHVLKAAVTAKMKIVFDAFFAALVSGGLQPIVMNRQATLSDPVAFTQKALLTYDISDKPAQQRRRVSKLVPTRVSGPV